MTFKKEIENQQNTKRTSISSYLYLESNSLFVAYEGSGKKTDSKLGTGLTEVINKNIKSKEFCDMIHHVSYNMYHLSCHSIDI